jgi:hypothetical protein
LAGLSPPAGGGPRNAFCPAPRPPPLAVEVAALVVFFEAVFLEAVFFEAVF